MISKSLTLPDGYQHFYQEQRGSTRHGLHYNQPAGLTSALRQHGSDLFYLYTQHQVFLQDGVIKHTRSSPNWDGGLVTFATCKHLMRTYREDWRGVWLGGLAPSHCAGNCVMFIGVVRLQFEGNYQLSRYLKEHHPNVYEAKLANNNPRGDLYLPRRKLYSAAAETDHSSFIEPQNHTRSLEFYKKSPGSTSEREDGLIPKWWRDLEYVTKGGRRPPVFILNPCWVFSRPMLWTTYMPRRASLKLTALEVANSLKSGAK